MYGVVQEVIIMADTCDVCGYKNSVVKGSGGISDKGRCFTLRSAFPPCLSSAQSSNESYD